MRRLVTTLATAAICTVLVAATVTTADARPRPAGRKGDFEANKTFGIGIMVGAPTGLSGKYFTGRDTALDFGIGVYGYGRRDRGRSGIHAHFDFLWHPVVLAKTEPFHLPLYFGIGGRFWDHDYYDDDFRDHGHVGVRVPVGISFDFNNVPLDIFFELAFVLDFVFDDYYEDDVEGDFAAALGVRYYFE